MENWKKLKRVITWLQQTINDVRIIRCENLVSLFKWIYAYDAVWNNTRIHTGMCMSMGREMIHANSIKQRPNTKISTEAGFVGVSDYFP